jgi:hypothetical protein
MGLRRTALRLGSAVHRLGAAAGLNPLAYYLYDQFTGPDGTRLSAHAMNVGPGWTEDGGSQWSITGNAAGWSGGTGTNVTVRSNAGHSDGVARVRFKAFQAVAYLVFRAQDSANFWMAGYNGAFTLYEVNAGTFTERGATAYGVPQTNDLLSVVLKGPRIDVLMNGALQISVTSSSFQTATGFGLFVSASDSTTRFDDFAVTG